MNRQGIEGVPDHLKVIGVTKLNKGEQYIDLDGCNPEVRACNASGSEYSYLKVEPDNVYNVYDLADVKIPEGYEFVEFREVVEYVDCFINRHGTLKTPERLGNLSVDKRRIIVKPVVKKTRRVLSVEQELYVTDDVKSVEGRFAGSLCTFPVSFRIEEREIS